jgi:2-C-methyl-D-erythritol 4-phosphate cytidylyltransferase
MKINTDFQLEFSVLTDETLPTAAIVVAAGNATRMGKNKQFATLLGIPVLARTLLAFEKSKEIRDIVIVAKETEIPDVQKLLDTYQVTKVTAIVSGGKERQDSVANGLSSVSADILYVAIHDGARPLITPDLIEKVLHDAKQNGAAALGVPVKDTIKRVNEKGMVTETPDRSTLYAVQTPQVFDIDIYKKSLAFAKEHNLAVTDDCQICESAGYPVLITQGSYRNLKITTPEDLILAEALLREDESHD